MPKRPKKVEKIDIQYLDLDEDEQPECFGEWVDTCSQTICGSFFDTCKYNAETEPF